MRRIATVAAVMLAQFVWQAHADEYGGQVKLSYKSCLDAYEAGKAQNPLIKPATQATRLACACAAGALLFAKDHQGDAKAAEKARSCQKAFEDAS